MKFLVEVDDEELIQSYQRTLKEMGWVTIPEQFVDGDLLDCFESHLMLNTAKVTIYGGVAELADAPDSNPGVSDDVRVRVSPPPPTV